MPELPLMKLNHKIFSKTTDNTKLAAVYKKMETHKNLQHIFKLSI